MGPRLAVFRHADRRERSIRRPFHESRRGNFRVSLTHSPLSAPTIHRTSSTRTRPSKFRQHLLSLAESRIFFRFRKTVAFSKWDYPYTLTVEQWEEKKRKAMQDRLKKVVEGSNEGLMKDFFTQLSAGREKWLVPEKTFCKSFLIFSCLASISRCYLRPSLAVEVSIALLHLSLSWMASARGQRPI